MELITAQTKANELKSIIGKEYKKTTSNETEIVKDIALHAIIWDGVETGEYDVRIFFKGKVSNLISFVRFEDFETDYVPL